MCANRSGMTVVKEGFRNLDEQSFRYNHRWNMGDADRFFLALSPVTGKRLTYAEVTGKVGERAN